MTNPTIVDASTAWPNRGAKTVVATINQDGSALNVTGKTVTATVRWESDSTGVLDAALEDHAVTLTTPANGIVTLTLTNADQQLLSVPEDATVSRPYLIAFKVLEDDYFPDKLRIHWHGVLD